MPKVSVIIPCYNQGKFLDEAVDSIMAQTLLDFEIVIVNDGSSDPGTRQLLAGYKREKTTILHTTNQGLAAARNNGISKASGKYILPLDADDRIGPQYLEKAVALLENNPDTGIVYCRARLFGAVETDWNLPEYTLAEMLQDNIIFCTAMFRRSDWDLVGGYDSGMVYGWEDYDFWLSLIERGRGVCQIPETLFYYRVASDSMVRSKEKWQKVEMFKRIFNRHQTLFAGNIEIWIDRLLSAREAYLTSRLYVDTGEGVSDRSSISRKVIPGRVKVQFPIAGFHSIRAIRFDPVDTVAVISITCIRLHYREYCKELVLDNLTSNALIQEKNYYYFDTHDPNMFIALGQDELAGLLDIQIDYELHATQDDALRMIIHKLQGSLECVRKEPRAEGLATISKSVMNVLQRRKNPFS